MISIIGAGPVGCYLGYLLAKEGKEVQIFEEHSSIGKPIQCTGIVSSNLADIIEIKEEFILNRVKGAKIFSPNGSFVQVSTVKEQAYIIDRKKFDLCLADKAKKSGVKIFLGYKFLNYKNGEIVLKNKKIKTDYLLGADGPLSQVAKSTGLFKKRKFFVGVQARVKMKVNPELVELYFGSKVAPKFFGWVVPESDNIVRVGLASFTNTKFYFNNFLKKRIGNSKIIEKQAGLIPYYNPKIKTQKNNIFLVGDAAGQVKATTGGGIVMGLLAAKELSKAIIENRDYEKLWKKKIGVDLYLNLKIRKFMNKMTDKEYNKLISLLKNKRTKEFLEKKGDMDFPSRFIPILLLKQPKLLYFLKLLFR